MTETARHRTSTLTAHGRLLDTALAQVPDDPAPGNCRGRGAGVAGCARVSSW
ncbi:hypothetical protein [Streptomyces sp. CB01881]|uniref:hypothetical protein n=1 Tax=Streptomyces sp. CB01881 TaxID=2078691 RepID=UPI00129CF0A3|nr:hypothetical protein [Streptomyces sp. CB01881]